MDTQQALKVKVTLGEAWMEIVNPDLTVDEAVDKLKDLGNNILKIDYENRRVLVAEGK